MCNHAKYNLLISAFERLYIFVKIRMAHGRPTTAMATKISTCSGCGLAFIQQRTNTDIQISNVQIHLNLSFISVVFFCFHFRRIILTKSLTRFFLFSFQENYTHKKFNKIFSVFISGELYSQKV